MISPHIVGNRFIAYSDVVISKCMCLKVFSKTVCGFLLYTKKETSCVLFYNKVWLLPQTQVRALGLCCYFYLPRNQLTFCQYKLSQKTSAAHQRGTIGLTILESKQNICTLAYRRIKYNIMLSSFISYTPKLVPIFYSMIKRWYWVFF